MCKKVKKGKCKVNLYRAATRTCCFSCAVRHRQGSRSA